MEVGFKSRERYGGVSDGDSEPRDLFRGLASGNSEPKGRGLKDVGDVGFKLVGRVRKVVNGGPGVEGQLEQVGDRVKEPRRHSERVGSVGVGPRRQLKEVEDSEKRLMGVAMKDLYQRGQRQRQEDLEQLLMKLKIKKREIREVTGRVHGLMAEVQDKDDVIKEQAKEIVNLRKECARNEEAMKSALHWSRRVAELEVQLSS